MKNTKEDILQTALQLFAKDGYEAVSVSMVAGALNITKGALYKHYKNKQDIFDSIVTRMERQDEERAKEYEVPEGTLDEMKEKYRNTTLTQITEYSKAQFRYWTEDPFASRFRKMLTLEQYRSEKAKQLYSQYFVSGPLGYVTDLFTSLGIPFPKENAVRFYAPMFLLYSAYDDAADKAQVSAMADRVLEKAREQLAKVCAP